ncbi:MAG: cation:proton antiporter [Rhizomicrobium sp.]
MRRSSSVVAHFCRIALIIILCCPFPVHAAPGPGTQTAMAQTLTAGAALPKSLARGHGSAAGNGSSASGDSEAILVAEIVLLLLVGRILGEGMQRLGQPALMGNLLAGLVLGPSLLGLVWPEAQKALFPSLPAQRAMIDGISQIGILLLLLLTGMETDLKLVSRMKEVAIAISLTGVAVPFALGFMLGEWLPGPLLPQTAAGRLVPALFLGTALSVSSIKIVAMVVREMNFTRRNLGQIIISTAIIEDTIGWVIVAVTFGIAGAGRVDGLDLTKIVGGVVVFLLFCFTVGRWLVFSTIRWVNDTFRSEFAVITAILVIMGIMALITQALGIRTVLGAFMAGVLVGQSPILTGHIQQQVRGLISAFFMPVFFGLSGLAADLTILKDPRLALYTAGLVAIASIGKFAGAFLGSMIGGLKWRERIALGCAMNARGSTEVIVASIGLSMGALTQNLYTMIVTMAVVTTLAMPPMLRRALKGLPMGEIERKRVERERLDEKGFVPNLERLLLAVDTSPAGRVAARLAGLLAGGSGMPVTILKLDAEPSPGGQQMPGAQHSGRLRVPARANASVAQEVTEAAKVSAETVKRDRSEAEPPDVHLTTRLPATNAAETVREESRKGYDLLFIGIASSQDESGNIAPRIAELASEFEGPLALFSQPEPRPSLSWRTRVLLPVNGSPASRRAAEVAFALARPTGAAVSALFVSQTDGRSRTRSREESVLKDMALLAERYDVNLTTFISKRGGPAEAILREAGRGYGMIVMGVSPRSGAELFFGSTVTAVFRDWKNSLLLVSS